MKEDYSSSDSALKSYFEQIGRYSLLDFDEELDLSRRIQGGDNLAKEKLINSNLRLVVKIARGYLCNDFSLLDLIQEGNLGLITAASKYDYAKKVRFSTYASWWIKQAIVRAITNKRRTIRLPHRKEDAIRRIQKAKGCLSQILMREPTTEELSNELGISEEEVVQLLDLSESVVSLDTEINEDRGTLMDVLEDNSYNPDRLLMEKNIKETTMEILETLMEKEKKILMYRFSFYGGKKLTLKSIGSEMGISPETVRQIEIRALKKLRVHADEMQEYMYH